MFPCIFVDITEDVSFTAINYVLTLLQIPVEGPQGVAMYDFEGANDMELTFGAGEEIALLGIIDDQWLRVSTAVGPLHSLSWW